MRRLLFLIIWGIWLSAHAASVSFQSFDPAYFTTNNNIIRATGTGATNISGGSFSNVTLTGTSTVTSAINAQNAGLATNATTAQFISQSNLLSRLDWGQSTLEPFVTIETHFHNTIYGAFWTNTLNIATNWSQRIRPFDYGAYPKLVIDLDDYWTQTNLDAATGLVMVNSNAWPGGLKMMTDIAHTNNCRVILYVEPDNNFNNTGGASFGNNIESNCLALARAGIDGLRLDMLGALVNSDESKYNYITRCWNAWNSVWTNSEPPVFLSQVNFSNAMNYYRLPKGITIIGGSEYPAGGEWFADLFIYLQRATNNLRLLSRPGQWFMPRHVQNNAGTNIIHATMGTYAVMGVPFQISNMGDGVGGALLPPLQNDEIYSIQRDSTQLGVSFFQASNYWTFVRVMADGSRAVSVLNIDTNNTVTPTVTAAQLGWPSATRFIWRDIWEKTNASPILASFTLSLPAYGDSTLERNFSKTIRVWALPPFDYHTNMQVAGSMSSELGTDPLWQGVQLLLPFSEGTGTTVKDRSPNARSFDTGAFYTWTNGPSGGALHLTGVASITLPTNILTSLPAITCAAWFRMASVEQYYLVSKLRNDTGIYEFDLQVNLNGTVYWNLNAGAANGGTSSPISAEICDNKWHFLVGTWSAKSASANLYVDGVLRASTALSGNAITNTGAGTFIAAAGASSTTDQSLTAISSREWSADEVRAAYRRVMPMIGSISYPTNAVSGWPVAASTAGGFALVNSNGQPFVLLSSPGSTAWSSTNKWP